MNLYLTADQIGTQTGGGSVTYHESGALKELGPCEVWDREKLKYSTAGGVDPWMWDEAARGFESFTPRLAHFYAGTFSKTVAWLKEKGRKVTYTAAAHDVDKSRREHGLLGINFDYPHLLGGSVQWERYLAGYLAADVLVCPSTHSAAVMRAFGASQRIVVIPHGCDLPAGEKLAPPPRRFAAGYLGAYGPDKGVRYLMEAWKRLNYKDATLILAGRDSTHPFVRQMWERFGGGNVRFWGWVDDVTDFYNAVSVYVQPSITEGFGIEVLEAMAHGRPVLCSDGAGAKDVVPSAGRVIPAGDVNALAEAIEKDRQAFEYYWNEAQKGVVSAAFRAAAEDYSWDKVRAKYKELWRELLVS